jgi:hypothetical protein
MANHNAIPPDGGFKDHPERINRKGAPKKIDLSDVIQELLDEHENGKSNLDAVLKALVAKAKKGDIRAIQELFDRWIGKSKQSIDHTTKGEAITAPPIQWVDNETD